MHHTNLSREDDIWMYVQASLRGEDIVSSLLTLIKP